MDFLCFYITSKILHEKLKPFRVLFAAAVGGIYSVAVLFFEFGNITAILLDIVICLLMNIIVFLREGRFGRVLLCFGVYFGVSALLGGCMTALYSLFNGYGVAEGVQSDGLSVWIFVLLASVSSVAVLLFARISRRSASIRTCELTLTLFGVSLNIPAICDSGNLLHDPISGKPVVVIDTEYAERLLPCAVFEAITENRYSDKIISELGYADRFRLIPANTATGDGLMVAFRPDKMELTCGKKRREVNALFAIARLKSGNTAALVPTELMI